MMDMTNICRIFFNLFAWKWKSRRRFKVNFLWCQRHREIFELVTISSANMSTFRC